MLDRRLPCLRPFISTIAQHDKYVINATVFTLYLPTSLVIVINHPQQARFLSECILTFKQSQPLTEPPRWINRQNARISKLQLKQHRAYNGCRLRRCPPHHGNPPRGLRPGVQPTDQEQPSIPTGLCLWAYPKALWSNLPWGMDQCKVGRVTSYQWVLMARLLEPAELWPPDLASWGEHVCWYWSQA